MIEVDLRVDAQDWQQISDLEGLCLRALEAGAQVSGASGEVSLLLCDDDLMANLNATWRGKTGPTDVLSFPAGPEAKPLLGDISIGYGIAQRDAEAGGKTLEQHLSHLLIHGLLHLVGHDHIDDTMAVEMEALEVMALASLGWPDPYK
ncbi:MAG: rRNA maturation RNase YbeY [Pseudomonadota bacterium]